MSEGNGRPTVAWIDLAALRANFARLRSLVAREAAVMAVVKADAYGHAARLAAPALAEAGADWFGVATIEEGVELRECGIQRPILVLTGATRHDVEIAQHHHLSVAVIDADMARLLAEGVGEGTLAVHLKLDTGMTRLGVQPQDLDEVLWILENAPQLRLEGAFSHFADAASVASPPAEEQMRSFHEMLARLHVRGLRPRWIHLANSVACLTQPKSHGTLVRPGIILYGSAPADGLPAGWQPVMHLRTRIWQLKSVPVGRGVSYGRTFVTKRPSRIAVLPIGYADGYSRALSNRAEVLVRGQRAPVVGRVCMDLTMVDVTDIPGVEPDDEVVLWGKQGDDEISVDEVATWQDSISYEVLTRLGKRVPRRPI
jgi:alanine racemase